MDYSQEDSTQPSQDSVMTVVDEERHEVLYFAYGSNLSTEQMRERCPFSTAIGLGFLPGWRWIINERGYATVVPLDDHAAPTSPTTTATTTTTTTADGGVYGLLYLLPPRDEESLDVYESVPECYEKVQCQVRWVRDGQARPLPRGETLTALVYVDARRTAESLLLPRTEYVGRMERGIEDAVRNWGMDEEYANRAMRRFWKN